VRIQPDEPQPDFAELSARVYRLCLALVGDGVEAHDAAQESFMRAWSHRKRKKPGVSWWTWVGGFAVRVCRETRRRRRLSPLGESDLEETLPHGPAGALAHSIDPTHAALHEAIQALPTRQREVTILRCILGLSPRQVGEMLGCPAGTVKSNLHKAVLNLKDTLQPSEAIHDLR